MIDKLLLILSGYVVIIFWVALVCVGLHFFIDHNPCSDEEFTKIGAFFFSCIFAPIWEEAVFRHAPLQIAKKLGRKSLVVPVALISSVLFGWGHGYGPVSVLLQGVGGLVLCFVYVETGYCYWASVTTHFLWNLSIIYIFPLLNQFK